MAFDWAQYLGLAKALTGSAISSCSEEAEWRASISRAYYAAFCTARDFLGFTNHASNPHKEVRETFKRDRDKTKKKIGNQLNQLHLSRIKADYRGEWSGDISISRERDRALKQASEIVGSLQRLHP